MFLLIDNTKQGILGDVIIEDVVNAVHDGDSVRPGKTFVRILGIDCPEVISNHVSANQPQGVEAGKFVRDLLKGKSVTVQFWGKDKYKRPLVKISLNGSDVGEIILKNGFGWYVSGSTKLTEAERTAYIVAYKLAKKAKLGIWSVPNPMKPAQWRASHPYTK